MCLHALTLLLRRVLLAWISHHRQRVDWVRACSARVHPLHLRLTPVLGVSGWPNPCSTIGPHWVVAKMLWTPKAGSTCVCLLICRAVAVAHHAVIVACRTQRFEPGCLRQRLHTSVLCPEDACLALIALRPRVKHKAIYGCVQVSTADN